jgi:hypothetical protein
VEIVLSLNRLASHLRLPRAWLREEARAGRVPCLKIGRRMLFNVAAVQSVLAARAAKGEGATHER